MNNKDFDKKLKNGLQKYESDLDVDSFWASIESDVDEINKDEKKWRILPFLLFFLLGGVFVSILLHVDFVEEYERKDIVEYENEIPEIDLSKAKESEKNNFLTKNKAIETKTIINDFGKKESLNSAGKSVEPSSFSKNNIFPENTFLESETKNILLDLEKTKTANGIILDINKSEKPIIFSTHNNTIASLNKQLYLLRYQTSRLPLEDVKAQVKFNLEKQDSSKIIIEIQSGFYFVNRLLENENSESKELIDLRNETETMRGAFNFSLLGTWKPKPFLSFTTGLNFSQINEKFKFQGELFQKDSIENDIVAYQININEDSVAIFGDQVFNRKFSHNKLYFNKYRMIDIPVLVGFEKRINKFSFGGRVGVFVNLKLKTSGLIFQTSDSFVNLDSNQEEVFKSNVQLSYYFGGVLKYHLKNKWTVSAHPNFRFFPKNFSQNNTFTSQKYKLFGFNLGLEYGF